MSDNEYKIGYKKPPLNTRFEKGQSGNPKGRPKTNDELKTVSEIFIHLFHKKKWKVGNGLEISAIEMSLHRLVELINKGNLRAIIKALDLSVQFCPEGYKIIPPWLPSREQLAADDKEYQEYLKSEENKDN